MIWNELPQFWVLPLMLDFNSCYALPTVKQRFWRARALASASFKRSCRGIPKGCCFTPGVRCNNGYLNRMDGTLEHDSTRPEEYMFHLLVCPRKSGCPHHICIYIYVYILQVSSVNQKTSWICLRLLHPHGLTRTLPQKSGRGPTCNTETSLSLVEWGPGVSRRNLWELKKMSLLYTDLILSGLVRYNLLTLLRVWRISKAGTKGFFQELLLKEASSRHF